MTLLHPTRLRRARTKPRGRSLEARAERALERYAEAACRPLLESPDTERVPMGHRVRAWAVRAHDRYVRLQVAWAEMVDAERRAGGRSDGDAAAEDADIVSAARRELGADAAAAFESALQVMERATKRFEQGGDEFDELLEAQPAVAERVFLVLEWLSAVLCGVFCYLEAREPWMQRGAAEEACLLAKTWALEYAASVDCLFGTPHGPDGGPGTPQGTPPTPPASVGRRPLLDVIGSIRGGPTRVAEHYHDYAADAPCDQPTDP